MLDYLQALHSWLSGHTALASVVVFLIAMSESLLIIGVIVPGVVLMFMVGALVGNGALDLWTTLIMAFLGAVAGDSLSFWIGRYFHHLLPRLWPFKNNPHYIERGEQFFYRHGGKSILFGRFVGPVRAVIPGIAGMLEMPARKFLLVNIVSAALWAPAYLLPGVVFGASLSTASSAASNLAMFVLLCASMLLVLLWLLKRLFTYYLVNLFPLITQSRWFMRFDRGHFASSYPLPALTFYVPIVVLFCVLLFNPTIQLMHMLWPDNMEIAHARDIDSDKLDALKLELLGQVDSDGELIDALLWLKPSQVDELLTQSAASQLSYKTVLHLFAADLASLPVRRPYLQARPAQMLIQHQSKDEMFALALWATPHQYQGRRLFQLSFYRVTVRDLFLMRWPQLEKYELSSDNLFMLEESFPIALPRGALEYRQQK